MIDFLIGAVLGFLVGLAICYYGQIKTLYENRGKLSAVSNFADASSGLASAFGLKL